jgi:hypothetical protein
LAQLPLLRPDNKFVYFRRDFRVDGQLVRQYEIGIIQNRVGDSYNILIVRIDKCVLLPSTEFEVFNPAEVGDAYPKKVCNVCQRYLNTTLFEFNQNGRDNRRVRRPSCRDCREIINGVGASASEKLRWARTRPNLVPFKCPICGKTTIPGLTSKVVLDHNHFDGSVRGWICDSCNTGIGRFKDDIELLKKAIRYLENQGEG